MEFPKGVGEYPNCFRQVLDIPDEDLRLCGFSGCSCAALALGPPSALRACQSRVLVALVVLVSLLFHGLGEVCMWCGGAGESRIGMIRIWLLERRVALILAPKY